MSHNHSKAGSHKLRNTKSFMLESLLRAILIHESINTTLKRAKALRMVVEPIITLGKKAKQFSSDNDIIDDARVVALKRKAFAILKDRELVSKIFKDLANRYSMTNGGYTRINKTHIRQSDGTAMAQLSLISYE